jgi:hypothetical protein
LAAIDLYQAIQPAAMEHLTPDLPEENIYGLAGDGDRRLTIAVNKQVIIATMIST